MSDAPFDPPIHRPNIDNHVLFAMHDMACAVCHSEKAILQMNTMVFMPCDKCQSRGWEIRQRAPLWRRMLGLCRVHPLGAQQ